MCTCIVSLTVQIRLICNWCMKIFLRRVARISANGYANEYRYGYGIDTDTDTDKKSSQYIYGSSGLERSVNQHVSETSCHGAK